MQVRLCAGAGRLDAARFIRENVKEEIVKDDGGPHAGKQDRRFQISTRDSFSFHFFKYLKHMLTSGNNLEFSAFPRTFCGTLSETCVAKY